jgi:glucose-6-phosphate isomerase
VKNDHSKISIPHSDKNADGLDYIAGKSLQYVNGKAMEGTVNAHISGNVPSIIIEIDEMNEYNYGYLVYFFEKACGISGYTLGVNPFDQPGVEAYKKNMFRLLGKPGI